MHDPLSITDRDRLFALLEQREKGDPIPSEEDLRRVILNRVRGQDHVVEDVVRLIRQQKAKARRDRPVANLLFLGPSGTGKTEMAKAIAEALYGDEKHIVRFDCGELTSSQGKNRLIGSAKGFVGADDGGELTRAILNNPNRVVLFDEIEKASKDVFDLFLSMMGEGRLTEQGSGQVADFTRTVIILTSNEEHEAAASIREQLDDPLEQLDALKRHLRDCKTFRPEILGRFDRIHVFRSLPRKIVAEIAALKAAQVARQYDVELVYVDPEILFEALNASEKLKDFGMRELVRIIESMFADGIIACRDQGATGIEIRVGADGKLIVMPANEPLEEAHPLAGIMPALNGSDRQQAGLAAGSRSFAGETE